MTVLDCAQLYNIVVAEMRAVHRLSWEEAKDHTPCQARPQCNLPRESLNHYLANVNETRTIVCPQARLKGIREAIRVKRIETRELLGRHGNDPNSPIATKAN